MARISHYFKYALGALGWLYIGQDKDRISKVIVRRVAQMQRSSRD